MATAGSASVFTAETDGATLKGFLRAAALSEGEHPVVRVGTRGLLLEEISADNSRALHVAWRAESFSGEGQPYQAPPEKELAFRLVLLGRKEGSMLRTLADAEPVRLSVAHPGAPLVAQWTASGRISYCFPLGNQCSLEEAAQSEVGGWELEPTVDADTLVAKVSMADITYIRRVLRATGAEKFQLQLTPRLGGIDGVLRFTMEERSMGLRASVEFSRPLARAGERSLLTPFYSAKALRDVALENCGDENTAVALHLHSDGPLGIRFGNGHYDVIYFSSNLVPEAV